MKARTILITEGDLMRLECLRESARRFQPLNYDHLVRLQEELERATVVANHEVPTDVVTMNSKVTVKDLSAGRIATYKIVFPRDAHVAGNRISVLAPLGTALLGYRAGDVIEWDMPAGKKRFKLQAVIHQQPEAARLAS